MCRLHKSSWVRAFSIAEVYRSKKSSSSISTHSGFDNMHRNLNFSSFGLDLKSTWRCRPDYPIILNPKHPKTRNPMPMFVFVSLTMCPKQLNPKPYKRAPVRRLCLLVEAKSMLASFVEIRSQQSALLQSKQLRPGPGLQDLGSLGV